MNKEEREGYDRKVSLERAPMRDHFPKFKDFPAEFGGSGEQVAE